MSTLVIIYYINLLFSSSSMGVEHLYCDFEIGLSVLY